MKPMYYFPFNLHDAILSSLYRLYLSSLESLLLEQQEKRDQSIVLQQSMWGHRFIPADQQAKMKGIPVACQTETALWELTGCHLKMFVESFFFSSSLYGFVPLFSSEFGVFLCSKQNK